MSSILTSQDSVESDLTNLSEHVPTRRLFDLIEANQRVVKTLELDTVLQEAVDSARDLTRARYGVLALFDSSGGFQQTVTSGLDSHQLDRMTTPPVGQGLLGYLNELDGTLRVADIASHPRSVGVPEDHPPMRSFLGVQLRHEGTHLGNIYLADKLGEEEEFTELDEQIISRFAAQAGTAISNSQRFERERKIKTDLKALVQIAPVGLVVFDTKTGNVLTSNQECQRIGGAVGSNAKSWQETFENVTMFRADGRQIPVGDRPTTQVLQSGEIVRGEEITLRFADGRVVNTLINAAPIYSDRGEIVSVVVAMQDMALLDDSERMRAEYLGMVSHELRTPLTTIKGSIAALTGVVQSLNTTEPLQLVHIIDHQTEVMRTQINSLIELSHIEAGTLTLSLEPADVSTLVAEGVREFRRSHAGFNVIQDIPDDLPRVMVDQDRISQILRDMFAHASKYTSEPSTVSVKAKHDDLSVEFSVSIDSARPLAPEPPELMEQIRSAAGEEAIYTYAGDGLALSICKGIVAAHGGRFRTESAEYGHGPNFTFTLPVVDEVEHNQVADTFLPLWSDHSSHADIPSILVAGDDPETKRTILSTLSEQGYAAHEAQNLSEIGDLIGDTKPQLVVLDLADATPSEFDIIRAVTVHHRIPTIAVVHQGDGDRAALATQLGADWCLVKPISPAEVLTRIRTPLNKPGTKRRINSTEGYAVGHVVIDYASHAVVVAGQPIQLTATEYKLVFELSSKAGKVLTQDELLHRVWGPEYSGESQLLRAYVKTLRQKLGDNARHPSYIFTEHGIGYRMANV